MIDKNLYMITFSWQLFYMYTQKTLGVGQNPTAGAAVHQIQKYTVISPSQIAI